VADGPAGRFHDAVGKIENSIDRSLDEAERATLSG
jgi:hypothetical protein